MKQINVRGMDAATWLMFVSEAAAHDMDTGALLTEVLKAWLPAHTPCPRQDYFDRHNAEVKAAYEWAKSPEGQAFWSGKKETMEEAP